jgi:hypothetical protein
MCAWLTLGFEGTLLTQVNRWSVLRDKVLEDTKSHMSRATTSRFHSYSYMDRLLVTSSFLHILFNPHMSAVMACNVLKEQNTK